MAVTAFVAVTTANATVVEGNRVISWSATVNAGESLVVTISRRHAQAVPLNAASVSFNGQPLTPSRQSSTTDFGIEVWYIITPTPATANVVVTYPSGFFPTSATIFAASTFTGFPDIATPISFLSALPQNTSYVDSISLAASNLNSDALVFAVAACGITFDMNISSGTERYEAARSFPGGIINVKGAMATGADPSSVTITWDNPVDGGGGSLQEASFMEIFAIITPPLVGLQDATTTADLGFHLQDKYLPGKGKGVRDLGGLSLFGPGRKRRGGVRPGRI